MTFRMGENETEVDFVLIGKDNLLYVMAMLEEFQHALVVAEINIKEMIKK